MEDVEPTRQALKNLNCDSEISGVPILISVDIPPIVSYSKIKEYFFKSEEKKLWSYEESCIAHSN